MDLVFFAANTTKLFEVAGSHLIAVTVPSLMLTWRKGQQLVQQARTHLRMSTQDFLQRLELDPPLRIPGQAVVLASTPTGIDTLLHHLKHNRVLHERVFLVSVQVTEAPTVPDEDRAAEPGRGGHPAVDPAHRVHGGAEHPGAAPRSSDPLSDPRPRSRDRDLLRRPPDRGPHPGSTWHGVLAGDRVFHAEPELRADRGPSASRRRRSSRSAARLVLNQDRIRLLPAKVLHPACLEPP